MTAWTEERVAKLRELVGTGLNSREIAERIGGVSREAVLKKARRIGLDCMWPHSQDGSKSRRMIELAKQGLSPREIEAQMRAEGSRTTTYSVTATLSYARRRGECIPIFRERGNAIPVDCGEFIGVLADEAHARGLTPAALAGLILDAVVSDNLIDAVLDTEAA